MYYLTISARPESNISIFVHNVETNKVEETYNIFYFDLISAIEDLANNFEFDLIIIIGPTKYCEKIKQTIDEETNYKYTVTLE